MIPYEEVKQKSKRKNASSNDKLHFFASKFSMMFSWVFINLGLSANQVTLVFFIAGLLSCYFYFLGGIYVFLAYIFWRLHIIFDLSDGDVARFNQTFSINGSYWDYMIHSVLYPLSFISISLNVYFTFNDPLSLIIGMLGSLVMSLNLATKNNYYRAMLFSNVKLDTSKGKLTKLSGLKFQLKRSIQALLSYEGFLLIVTTALFLEASNVFLHIIMVFYSVVMASISFIKFYLFSKNGFYSKRS
ncbi:CDP-alcohol phosphatidyltransferase family protein [Vibrio coralliilyticus]|uniref:Uncharacterized protein n=1 Tax=Vibrio coralliilyticus TaxID=190893 RepID=A0AAN0SFZ6_9VIBR|nr:CDP-alcohol phosphatidyltransferase family protein [Vibrio coralliilyticus]AIW20310.1 hypothetical protein IX92_15270 [Vibrio coralliilyticus]NOH38562.1 CDP-alcohol phosphatidyltransferase family protein [Vibrio coralliilyticus]